jgi:hypothetical protein
MEKRAGLDIDAIRRRQLPGGSVPYRRESPPTLEADLKALLEEIETLRERIADFEDDYRKVTSEKCAPDELHCSCVPHLRRALREANNVSGK